MICVEVSRKFSKNPHFWQKSISANFEIFEGISTEVPPSRVLLAKVGRGADKMAPPVARGGKRPKLQHI